MLRRHGYLVPALLPVIALAADAQSLRWTHSYVSVAQNLIYNGFTTTERGVPVQGSQVSPFHMSTGYGLSFAYGTNMALETEAWAFVQEYAALAAHDKTVPTQIESGNAVGEIARLVTLVITVPWVYRLPWGGGGAWSFEAKAGLSLAWRIPIAGVDGSQVGPATTYFLAWRFIYPHVGLAAGYRLNERIDLVIAAGWDVPLYNLWDSGPPTPFLDETMVRYGLRVVWNRAPS